MTFKNNKIFGEDSPFSSKNYPFSKEWNKYSAESLGRAFFSDGNVKSIGIPEVYDHIQLFTNSNFGFSNEPRYYKYYEIKLFIYTLDDYNDLKDKYYKADLDFDQMCVFFCKQENEVITKIKLGESLQKHSRFDNADQTANFTLNKSLIEIQGIELSTKKILEFLSKEKPLFQTDLIQDYKNIELKEVCFLDEKEHIIKVKQDEILEMPISNLLYGEKVKIRVTGTQIEVHSPVKIKLIAKSENENQKFEGIEKMVWTAKFDKNIAETPYFKIPLSWFDESIEKYNYREDKEKPLEDEPKAYKTTFDKNLTEFSIEVSYGKVQKLVNKEEHRLIPTSYRRNYEELNGLFKKDDKSGSKTTKENYENYFISLNAEIEKIVTGFTKFIEEFPNDVYKYKSHLETGFNGKQKKELELKTIKTRVEKDASELWKKAVTPFSKTYSYNYDDRPLYWARLKMQSQLKRLSIFKEDIDFEKSLVIKKSKLEEIITLFEEKSRNYTGINFNFSSQRKILITGFDPFLLNSIEHNKYKSGFNINQSNPSGCAALLFAGINLDYANVQTMVIPVRYTDFDNSEEFEEGIGEGVIEKYLKPWIGKVQMIITISQYLPGENVIDMFGTVRRGGFNDNQNYLRETGSKAIETKTEWIQTTLKDKFTFDENIKLNWKYNDIEHLPYTFPNEDDILSEGSGGDYLSNEIFYRVAKLRNEIKPTLPTGHFHIQKLQNVGKDFNNNQTAELLKIIKNAVNEASKKL